MIFENNYAYAGTTAIIYNFEIDYSDLDFYVKPNNNIGLQTYNTLTEIGIEYKKESDENWTNIIICNESVLNSIKNGSNAEPLITKETNDYVMSGPIGIYKWNFLSPIRVVIKNLEQTTTYNIRSYYFKSNDSDKHVFNFCTVTTLTRQNVYYELSEIKDNSNGVYGDLTEKFQRVMDKACDIYNSMTAFTREAYKSDNLKSQNGGSFTATIGDAGTGAAANSSMIFAAHVVKSYSDNMLLSTAMHEMAHNLMKDYIDETYSEEAYNEIVKFMEFATHAPKATWRWNNRHNYPIISSAKYNYAHAYLVAAACYVCRKATGKI